MKHIVLTAFLICFSISTFACTCGWNGHFFKIAKENNVIVKVKVKRHTNYGIFRLRLSSRAMKLKVIEVLNGKEGKRTIKVWGDNGVLCRPYVSQFIKGKTYIMALNSNLNHYKKKGERKNQYSISNCGEYWLEVNQGMIEGVIENEDGVEVSEDGYPKRDRNGNIIKSVERMNYNDFKNKLAKVTSDL